MASSAGESRVRESEPKREWLLRCRDAHGELAVCSIGVGAGELEVCGPDDTELFRLHPWEVAAFRRAFDEAITQVEADLAAP
ncbi:hypothetical protein MOQ72_17500 [Saccharopolyspora sp. K220]|uniref:hypothetical protein n=1 Tax=Saccharopolyspora soli TaxID=2926618 RepID=UPI001F5AAF39|nr:hypothetical protein [Saccharopolyspora soli]MCI2419245.1 hypothetical protein [Saccharopolyspora soli]